MPDPTRVLAEVARVLRPGGELRFYEHVVARNWPSLFGGCHTSRDTEATLIASGFTIDARERFSSRPTVLAIPVAPRILAAPTAERWNLIQGLAWWATEKASRGTASRAV